MKTEEIVAVSNVLFPEHELKNNFQMIFSSLEYVLMDKNLSENSRKWLLRIKKEVGGINQLMHELLHLSKGELPQIEYIDLNRLVSEQVDYLSATFAHSGIGLNFIPTDNPAIIQANLYFLKTVVVNLLMNAKEAIESSSRHKGNIRLWSEISPESICLLVEDDGPGIQEEIKEIIFDPAFTTKRTGTGIGLALCKKLLDLMGGGISVRNGEGGAIFVLSFKAKTATP